MATNPTFSTALVGQAESAFGAILDRELTGTGLSAPHWITLTLAIAGGGSVERAQLIRRVARARKVTESQVEAYVKELAAAQLLQAPDEEGAQVTVTDAGQQLHGRMSTAVAEITQRLWGDLAAEDLATAARVLSTVLARANQELSHA
jgi:DNA-binding MarR family transcriptional regulator